MAIINRVSHLFRADIHAVLDHLEAPEALLRQSIRDMREALDRRTELINSAERQQARLSKMLEAHDGDRLELDRQLDLAFESDQEDLCRQLVRRKLQLQQACKALREERERASDVRAENSEKLAANRHVLEKMVQKLELLELKAESSIGFNDDLSVCDADIDLALLQEKASRSAS